MSRVFGPGIFIFDLRAPALGGNNFVTAAASGFQSTVIDNRNVAVSLMNEVPLLKSVSSNGDAGASYPETLCNK